MERRSLHEAEKSAAYDYLCRLDEAKRYERERALITVCSGITEQQ